MMPAKKWRYLDVIRGHNSDLVTVTENEVNVEKTHGMWVLFVDGHVRDDVTEWLAQQLVSGPFILFGTGETEEGSSYPRSYVFAIEEGHLKRRQLWTRMKDFHNLGVGGPWLYEDVGSKRHSSTRRMLSGQNTRGNVTEVDYRESAKIPIERVIPFPR